MPVKNESNVLHNLVSLHGKVSDERTRLLERLRELDETLEKLGFNATVRHYGLRTPTGRIRNKQSLKDLVVDILSKKSLTKPEVLAAVLQSGYQFSTDDPLNSLGVVLYGKNPQFKRVGGRFSIS